MSLRLHHHRWASTQGLPAQHEPPQRIPGSTVVRRVHLLEVVGAQQLRGGASSLASGSQCGSFGCRRNDRLLAEQRGAAEVSCGRVTDESVQGRCQTGRESDVGRVAGLRKRIGIRVAS
jgi:hypothetical protein